MEKEKKEKKDGFFKEVRNEMKEVKWPSAKDVVKFTLATVIMCAIFIAFFTLINLGVAKIIDIRG